MILCCVIFRRSYLHTHRYCIMVTSEEGQFFLKAADDTSTVCGMYIITDPDRRVEVHFEHLDVPCQNGGLVSFVDGWELNGQFFPSPEDHPKPLNLRYREFCGQRRVKQVLESSQNAALIQYRMPHRGKGFSFTVRFLKNSMPCNILLEGTADVYTLRNYGKHVNCSVTTLFPAKVKVLSLNVGLQDEGLETGTIHKCQKRGLPDYVQLGGSQGLDTTHLVVADSLCGMDSKPGSTVQTIFCGVTTVRLVSSGQCDNAVTITLQQAGEDDIMEASLICGL
ncbi:corticotropin-releasing factor-binding protein isoform X2 [Cryptotermes secundus]|uniref:corticotropin-releasing factor-binding protein isoform X2 n=1 Tax=Cryptotermes secundus TaxID=105785 RepID=UPI000CD7C2BA|nr:corticotropin-releasing factor-binding protein isoform X2 [Cryptotermes secundus]